MRRLRYSIIVNREYHAIMPILPTYQQLLLADQGSYSFEAVGAQTRITFTSNDPIRPVYTLDPDADPLRAQMEMLSALKQRLEAAIPVFHTEPQRVH